MSAENPLVDAGSGAGARVEGEATEAEFVAGDDHISHAMMARRMLPHQGGAAG